MLWCWMDMQLDEVRGQESFRNKKALYRIRYRLPLSTQGVILFRMALAAQPAPRLSSRNRSSVEGEWFW